MTFGSSLNSADSTLRDVTVNAGSGAITLSGAVGTTNSLGVVALNSTRATTITGAIGSAGAAGATSVTTNGGGAVAIDGGNVRTTGVQTYGGAATLGANTALATANSAVTFGSTLNSANAIARNLSIDTGTGNIVFTGAIGTPNAPNAPNPLGAISLNSSGTTTLTAGLGNATVAGAASLTTNSTTGTAMLNGGVVHTSGAQDYRGPVALLATTSLTTTANGAVTFGSTLNSSGGVRDLAVTSGSGNITLTGNVGAIGPLGVVSLNSGGATTLVGSIAGAGTTAGAASLTTDALGTTAINTPLVRTSGTQLYGDTVTLGVNTTLSTNGADVTLGSTVNGARSLTIDTRTGDAVASAGSVEVKGNMGGTTALTKVDISARDINLRDVTTTDEQVYRASRLLFLNSTYKTNGGNITIDSGRSGLTPSITLWKSTSGDLVFDLSGGAGGSLNFNQFDRIVVSDGSFKVTGANAVQLPDTVASKSITIDSKSLTFFGERILAPTIAYNATSVTANVRLDEKGQRPNVIVLGTAYANLSGTGLLTGGLSLALLDSTRFKAQLLELNADVLVANPVAPTTKLLGGVDLPFSDARTTAFFNFPTPVALPAISRTDVAALLTSGVPTNDSDVPQEAAISASLREEMQVLGIFARAPNEAETRARFNHAAIYAQFVFNEGAASEEFKVVDIRLSETAVRSALKMYHQIFNTEAADGTKVSRVPELTQSLTEAYRHYLDSNAGAEPTGFRGYLESNSADAQNAAALHFVHGMSDLFGKIEKLGLTNREGEISKSQLLRPLRVPGLSTGALRQNIERAQPQIEIPMKTAATRNRSEKGPGQ